MGQILVSLKSGAKSDELRFGPVSFDFHSQVYWEDTKNPLESKPQMFVDK